MSVLRAAVLTQTGFKQTLTPIVDRRYRKIDIFHVERYIVHKAVGR